MKDAANNCACRLLSLFYLKMTLKLGENLYINQTVFPKLHVWCVSSHSYAVVADLLESDSTLKLFRIT